MKVYHMQIAAENLVGRIVELHDSTQTFQHQHTSDDILFLAEGIDFVHGRCGKFHTCLLELEVGGASTVQQGEHRA